MGGSAAPRRSSPAPPALAVFGLDLVHSVPLEQIGSLGMGAADLLVGLGLLVVDRFGRFDSRFELVGRSRRRQAVALRGGDGQRFGDGECFAPQLIRQNSFASHTGRVN